MTTHTNARPMPAVDPPRAEQWTIDAHRDANGHFTIRIYDGTITGDTVSQPIATVYRKGNAIAIEQVPDLLRQRDALLRQRDALAKAVRSALIASEDNGDMDDIDWAELRAALAMCD